MKSDLTQLLLSGQPKVQGVDTSQCIISCCIVLCELGLGVQLRARLIEGVRSGPASPPGCLVLQQELSRLNKRNQV